MNALEMASRTIKVFIADDHPIVREGLHRIVSLGAEFHVVGEAATGEEVLEKLARADADVLLLDVAMPGPGLLEVLSQVRRRHPRLAVLVLSMYGEDLYAMRALKAGASGYLTKERTPDELVEAIRRVHSGRTYVSATLAESLGSRLRPGGFREPHERLSEREYEVFRLLARGRSVKEIAAELKVSVKTVSTHRVRLLSKMHFKTNADLVRYAMTHGLA